MRVLFLLLSLLAQAFAAQRTAMTKAQFFLLLKQNKGKPEATLKAVKERGCDFRLSSGEEAQALGVGADFSLLVQIKINHKDNEAGRAAQKRSAPKRPEPATGAPRTPRTP